MKIKRYKLYDETTLVIVLDDDSEVTIQVTDHNVHVMVMNGDEVLGFDDVSFL